MSFQTAQLSDEAAVEYKVKVSLPQYFTLPTTVKIPITQEDSVPWDNPAGETHICVGGNIPIDFQGLNKAVCFWSPYHQYLKNFAPNLDVSSFKKRFVKSHY